MNLMLLNLGIVAMPAKPKKVKSVVFNKPEPEEYKVEKISLKPGTVLVKVMQALDDKHGLTCMDIADIYGICDRSVRRALQTLIQHNAARIVEDTNPMQFVAIRRK